MGLDIEHFCERINLHLKNKEIHFNYNQRFREYSIDYKRKYGGGVQLINFCPWCGIKLPESLREKLFDILLDEFNLDGLEGLYDPNLPEEFKSNEWWKKRNL